MGFSLNQVNLIGRLGRDAETRFTSNNVSVTNFSIVTEHSYKKNDEWVKQSTWHNITAFNLSDWHKEALKKGVNVHVGGRIDKNEYTDKDGVKRYSVNIIADNQNLVIFDTRSGDSERSTNGEKTQGYDSGNHDNDDLPF